MSNMKTPEDPGTQVGREIGKDSLMAGEFQELIMEALVTWVGRYREDLGEGLARTLRIIETDEDHIDVEVRVSRWREPLHTYRMNLSITELETE